MDRKRYLFLPNIPSTYKLWHTLPIISTVVVVVVVVVVVAAAATPEANHVRTSIATVVLPMVLRMEMQSTYEYILKIGLTRLSLSLPTLFLPSFYM